MHVISGLSSCIDNAVPNSKWVPRAANTLSQIAHAGLMKRKRGLKSESSAETPALWKFDGTSCITSLGWYYLVCGDSRNELAD